MKLPTIITITTRLTKQKWGGGGGGTPYHNSSKAKLDMIRMFISTKYKNDDTYSLHRAPLPNLSFPDAHLCMGNAFKDTERSFDPNTIQKNIHKIMLGGWNTDWHKNEGTS